MPPFVARKRQLSTPPSDPPSAKKIKKPSLFDALDNHKPESSVSEKKKFLDSLAGSDEGSSLSDAESAEFEDVLPHKKQKRIHAESEDEDIDWEDALKPDPLAAVASGPPPTGDLELTLSKTDNTASFQDGDKKRGPSKIERQIRTITHQCHVQFLMFHNAIRNAWLCDKELQNILLDKLSPTAQLAVEQWKRDCGMKVEPKAVPSQTKGKGKQGRPKKVEDHRNQRDWGKPAQRLEQGNPNLSHGDPIMSLLRALTLDWRQRFTVTAPGLRKQGYKSVKALKEEIASFHNDKHNSEEHGERIASLEEFRKCAKACEGSRDVGAQLFTALLRGLGIEARLVANLQPVGFAWTKAEEAPPKKGGRRSIDAESNQATITKLEAETTLPSGNDRKKPSSGKTGNNTTGTAGKVSQSVKTTTKQKNRNQGAKVTPIELSDSSDLSDITSAESDSDDSSIVDITPQARRPPQKRFDKDLAFPIYWTEAVSSISHEVYSVNPMVVENLGAKKPEILAAFEPRGTKAEKAKQVIAYVIAHSPDGSAKDVTTRYLKNKMWPGKTKGYRLPVEKVAVLNRRGKVKYYEDYDWFKRVMSGYTRPSQNRTLADDKEDEDDLKPTKPEKRATKEGEETLQGYKQSAEFVLERHLRREEAIIKSAEPVKTFSVGKGDNVKEEPVYRRADVVACKTEESWHKDGRRTKPNMEPLKLVPVRAVTLTRKREAEEITRRTGEKPMQGLYSKEQTEYIIPPPIQNGIIPKNEYGNIDCFVPTMVPRGAVHVPLRGTVRVCKKLGIDYAEAVTGFEFGNKRAVPVCEGVVVAVENEDALIDAWEQEEAAKKIREDDKREKLLLSTWKKFLIGLRIIERVRDEYGEDVNGHVREEHNPFTNKSKQLIAKPTKTDDYMLPDSDLAEGFMQDEDEGESVKDASLNDGISVEQHEVEGGGFIIDEPPSPSPDSAESTHVELAPPPKTRKLAGPKTQAKKERKLRLKNTAATNSSRKSKTEVPRVFPSSDEHSDSGDLAIPSLGSESSAEEQSESEDAPETPKTAVAKDDAKKSSQKSLRKSLRKSASAVRSRYFEHPTSEEEDEDKESSEEEDHDPASADLEDGAKKKRGRGRPALKARSGGAVRGGKRGRGRPRKTM